MCRKNSATDGDEDALVDDDDKPKKAPKPRKPRQPKGSKAGAADIDAAQTDLMNIDWGPMADDGGVPLPFPPFVEDPSTNPMDPNFQLADTSFDGNAGLAGCPTEFGVPEAQACLIPSLAAGDASEASGIMHSSSTFTLPDVDDQQHPGPCYLPPPTTKPVANSMPSSGKFSLRSKHPLSIRSSSGPAIQNIADTCGPSGQPPPSCSTETDPVQLQEEAVPALNPVVGMAPLTHLTAIGPEYDDEYD